MRTAAVFKLDIEDPAGNLTEALVNPSRARIAYVAARAEFSPPPVGVPGH